MQSKKVDTTNAKTNGRIDSILVSIFIPFMFCCFSVVESFALNRTEFWFDIRTLIPIIVVPFAVCTIAFLSLQILCRGSLLCKSLIFAIGIVMYIQGNFLMAGYGVFDGKEKDWNSYSSLNVISIVLWILIPIVSILFAKSKPRLLEKIIRFGIMAIIIIQIITLCAITVFSNESLLGGESVELTYEGCFDVSTEKNIAVFIVDAMDAEYFNTVVEEYPEVEDVFSGFTYYKNTMGLYPTTKASIPQIATGEQYKNETEYQQYIESAWETSALVSQVKRNGFSYGLYSKQCFVSNNVLDENTIINAVITKTKPRSYFELAKNYYKLILFKYSPNIIKKYFVVEGESFDDNKMLIQDDQDVYSLDTVKLYEKIRNGGIKLVDGNILRVYHYEGAHAPYRLDENLKLCDSTPVKQTRGALKVVEEYIHCLKENNCYDNSMIVVLADHGSEGLYREHPALLIKNYYENHKLNFSDAPITYADLPATIMSGITDEYGHYGRAAFEINSDEIRTRYYYYYYWDDSWDKAYLPNMYEYVVEGNRGIQEADQYTQIYRAKKSIGERDFGKGLRLSFCNEKDRDLVLSDIAEPESEGSAAWSINDDTRINIKLNADVNVETVLSLGVEAIVGYEQNIEVFVNNYKYGEQLLTNDKLDCSIVLPANTLKKGDNIIVFKYSNPERPVDLIEGSKDYRRLAVALRDMRIIPKSEYYTDIETLNSVNLSNDEEFLALAPENWNNKEKEGIWTKEKSAIVIRGETQDYVLEFSCHKVTEDIEAFVEIDGDIVGTIQEGDNQINLPAKYFGRTKVTKITFHTPKAKRPIDLGINEDTRTLGIFVKELRFSVKE